MSSRRKKKIQRPTKRQQAKATARAMRDMTDVLAGAALKSALAGRDVKQLTPVEAAEVLKKVTAQLNNAAVAMRTRKAQIQQKEASN
jgi:hypothetical protein